VFLSFLEASTASAFLGNPFGGRILHSKANEISVLEATGFTCLVMGETITIKPMGSPFGTPTSYYIPFSTRPKTGGVGMGKLILGKYTMKTPITCTHPTSATTTVTLDTINYYGTSR